MFELRMFNSDLGKWLSPDPYGQYKSPYIGMGNNPVNGTDPDGAYFVGGLGRGAMIAIATNKMNENIAANAKASYWESRKKFMGSHGEMDINVDVNYVTEIGQADAVNLTLFGTGPSFEFPTAPVNGGIYDQSETGFEGSAFLARIEKEGEAQMMSWKTTVDVTFNFNGVSGVIAHAEFDEGADADAFAHAQAERYSANTGYMWNEVKAEREKMDYAGMVGSAKDLLNGVPKSEYKGEQNGEQNGEGENLIKKGPWHHERGNKKGKTSFIPIIGEDTGDAFAQQNLGKTMYVCLHTFTAPLSAYNKFTKEVIGNMSKIYRDEDTKKNIPFLELYKTVPEGTPRRENSQILYPDFNIDINLKRTWIYINQEGKIGYFEDGKIHYW